MPSRRRRWPKQKQLYAETSLRRPQWNDESVCHSDRPDVAVADCGEGPAVTGECLPPIVEVVVQAEFGALGVHTRQIRIAAGNCAGMKDLCAPNELCSAQKGSAGVPQTIRAFDPEP